MHFDWTISFSNLLTTGSFLFLAVIAWRDMSWRIKNLEEWRKEHMVDADARDQLIRKMEKILDHVRWQSNKMGGSSVQIESEDAR